MPYICTNCGETEDFVAEASCTRTYTAYGSVRVNSEGDWDDFYENDASDTDVENLEYENVRCGTCDESVVWHSEEEIEEIQIRGVFHPQTIVCSHSYTEGGETELNY